MKKLLLLLALICAPTTAFAQCTGVFQPGYVCGNNTGAPKTPAQIPASGFGTVPGGSNGQIQYNNAGAFGGLSILDVPRGGTGASTFTSGLPLIGAGTSAVTQGTRTGNTTQFATATGTFTSGNCVAFDVNKNLVDAGTTCAGGGGSGIAGMVLVTQSPYNAACNNSTNDNVAIQAALNSGAGTVLIPAGVTCVNNANLSIPAGVTLAGISKTSTIRRPTFSITTNSPSSVANNTIFTASTTGLTVGMFGWNATNGYPLPGTISAINPNTTVTMSASVGVSATITTTLATAAGSNSLSFGTGPAAFGAQYGMYVYDTTQGRQLPGTVSSTTLSTPITMSANVGAPGVGAGDVLTFGYPIASADVLVFGTYNGVMFTLGSNSTVRNLTINDGSLDTGNTGGTFTASGTTGWTVDNVSIVGGGRYCFQFASVGTYTISNSTCSTIYPSNKNNNSGILSFCFGGPGASGGQVINNIFDGFSIQHCEQNLKISGNTIKNFKYGAGITCTSEPNAAWYTLVNNQIFNGTGLDSNITWVEGIECWAPNSIIANNLVYNNAGAGISFGGQYSVISNNNVYDNGKGTPSPGIYGANQGAGVYSNGSFSFVTGNTSRSIYSATQNYGYYDSAGMTNMTFGINNFSGTVAKYSVNSTSNYNTPSPP